MEIYYVKVAQITGKLQWPLDVYGDVAVRDNLDYKRNYLFRRSRERCQTLTSPQACAHFVPSHSVSSVVSIHLVIRVCTICCTVEC
ncbi:hypothetical protein PR202_gb00403 [Eleusine coracana subsp. coracana]|uniref:DUF6598 domain-containing protein n=1 Tax=Eleusine coracana subsp. coracana TaxID=191504 RepID=A0AAV5DTP1_ELECO|nr:hypothetical protein PR202_gb00403 [Eleusine coracana subsp. coracana]